MCPLAIVIETTSVKADQLVFVTGAAPRLDAAELVLAMDLIGTATLVGFVRTDADITLATRMAKVGTPAIVGVPVMDAVKHVAGGFVVDTLDRSELLAIDFPVVVETAAVRAAVATAADGVDIEDIIGLGDLVVLDRNGQLLSESQSG